MELDIRLSLVCDIGCTRPINEDMILISGETYRDCKDVFSTIIQDRGRFVAAVADGMGGHNAGEVASRMALDLFDNFIISLPPDYSDNDFRNKIDDTIKRLHNNLNLYGQKHPDCHGLGTTLVSWLTYENRIYIVNVGDSRLYRYRNGILTQLTTDHSEQNKYHDFSLPSNIIYNCLGGGGESAFADVMEITNKVFEDDVFLLCSDGLYDFLSEDEIEKILFETCDASSLVDAAKTKGGDDNISAIIITIRKTK